MSHREFHAQFPCTPADSKRIRRNSLGSYYGPHPLEGKSVAEWVAEARAGWPKVPVPKDPVAAACKLTDPAKTKDRPEWDTPTLEFDQ